MAVELGWLQALGNDLKLMLRRPPRQQYAALCYRFEETGDLHVLVATSRDTGRWIIPKGWPMEGSPAHLVAAQEAYEEAGVRGAVEEVGLGFYHYDKRLDQGLDIPVRVQVYALKVEDLAGAFPEKGERRLEWVPCQIAAERVDEPELKALLLGFAKRIGAQGGIDGACR